jgi:hypothetical protein
MLSGQIRVMATRVRVRVRVLIMLIIRVRVRIPFLVRFKVAVRVRVRILLDYRDSTSPSLFLSEIGRVEFGRGNLSFFQTSRHFGQPG